MLQFPPSAFRPGTVYISAAENDTLWVELSSGDDVFRSQRMSDLA